MTDNASPQLLFGLPPRRARHATAAPGHFSVLIKRIRFFRLRYLGCHPFTQHGKDPFQICHMIAQVFVLSGQPFQILMFRRRNTKCRPGDLCRQDAEIPLRGNAPLLPFIGQVLANSYAAQTLVDPLLRISPIGSSPLVRGTATGIHGRAMGFRFIPARAGNRTCLRAALLS